MEHKYKIVFCSAVNAHTQHKIEVSVAANGLSQAIAKASKILYNEMSLRDFNYACGGTV